MSERQNNREIDDGGNAFPAMLPGGNYCTPGMTLRDYFAGQALIGWMSAKAEYYDGTEYDAAERCYCYADAMMKARMQQ